MPAEKLAGVAIHDQRQRRPAVLSGPDPGHVGGPALVGCFSDRRQRFDPWSGPNGPFAHLPALQLEDPLHSVRRGARTGGALRGSLLKPSNQATVR